MRAICHDLTAEEQANVRRAIRFLRVQLGSWTMVSKVIRMKERTLRRIRAGHTVQPYVVRRVVAALDSVPLSDLLAGELPPPRVCPYCGHG